MDPNKLTLGQGEGDPRAKLWLIGRDFGETEQRLGRPFAGDAGAVLDRALNVAGIRRQDCYVDNLVPTRPPGNDWSRHRTEDIFAGKARLRELLLRHKPKLIVALGGEVSQFLLGEQWPLNKRGKAEGIQKIRGYLWDAGCGRVLTSLHPAACLASRDPSGIWETYFKLDMKKVRRELDLGCPTLPERHVAIATEIHHFQEVRNELRAARWVGVDIENDAELNLSCLGVAVSPTLAWVIPARTKPQLGFIRELCDGDFPKVLQNGQYDRFFLSRFCGIKLRNQVFDTMLAWHALQPELAGAEDKARRKKKGAYSRMTQKNLRFLASIFTRQGWWKSYNFSSDDEQYQLNGVDCCVTLEVAERLEEELAR